MNRFRKTRVMNIVGASGIGIMGVALFLNKMQEQPLAVLGVIVGLFAVLVLIPALTARALSRGGSRRLQGAMLRTNWVLIGFWGLMLVGSVVLIALGYMQVAAALGGLVGSALFYVVPEWINIRALRAALASENSSPASQAEKGESVGPIRSGEL